MQYPQPRTEQLGRFSVPVLMGILGATMGLVLGFLVALRAGANGIVFAAPTGLIAGAVAGWGLGAALARPRQWGARDGAGQRRGDHPIGSDVPDRGPRREKDSHRGGNALDWMQREPTERDLEDREQGRVRQRENEAGRLL